MAYSKQTWDTTSYVNPTRMNHIEQGVYDASNLSENDHISKIRLSDSDFTYDDTYKFWNSNQTITEILQGKALIGFTPYPNYAAMLISAYNNNFGRLTVTTFNTTTGTVGTSSEGFILDVLVRNV